MKYVNQINFVLVAAAAVAVIFAFSQTYLSSVPPPKFALTPTTAEDAPHGQTPSPEDDRSPASSVKRPSSLGSPRAVEPGSIRRAPSKLQPTPTRQSSPQATRPSPGRATSPSLPTARPTGVRRPTGPIAPPPISREAQRRGPRAQPQPVDEDEEAGTPPERDLPHSPEARRDQNRRVNPNPPPARSSMPEQRPQF